MSKACGEINASANLKRVKKNSICELFVIYMLIYLYFALQSLYRLGGILCKSPVNYKSSN